MVNKAVQGGPTRLWEYSPTLHLLKGKKKNPNLSWNTHNYLFFFELNAVIFSCFTLQSSECFFLERDSCLLRTGDGRIRLSWTGCRAAELSWIPEWTSGITPCMLKIHKCAFQIGQDIKECQFSQKKPQNLRFRQAEDHTLIHDEPCSKKQTNNQTNPEVFNDQKWWFSAIPSPQEKQETSNGIRGTRGERFSAPKPLALSRSPSHIHISPVTRWKPTSC